MFLGSLTTALGPVLRVYEYDRYNGNQDDDDVGDNNSSDVSDDEDGCDDDVDDSGDIHDNT